MNDAEAFMSLFKLPALSSAFMCTWSELQSYVFYDASAPPDQFLAMPEKLLASVAGYCVPPQLQTPF